MLKVFMTSDKVSLGRTCEVRIDKADPNLEFQVFIKRENIFYMKPLTDWIQSNKIILFPEAPGKYTILIKWRVPNKQTGQIEYPFRVISNKELADSPQLVRVDSTTSFWTPNQWEAQLISNYEKAALKQILGHVKSGWVVYDVGANLGYYSIYLAKAIGNYGHVYSFEANPVCVNFLQANLAVNHVQNCDILPCAILDRDDTLPFTINYSSSGLGITQKSSFYISKMGHEILVQGYALDQLIDFYGIRPPNLVKIDIEGAEEYAIRGMENILRKFHPMLLIEIHGKDAAEHTLPLIGNYNYQFQEIDGKRFKDVDDLLTSFTDKVIQLICFHSM